MEANCFACSALLSSRLWMVTFSVGQARFESPVPYLAENAKKALAATVAPTAEPLEGSVSQWTSERLGVRSPVMETTAEVENTLTVAMGEAGVIAETPTTGPTKEWRPMLLVVVLELARQHRHRHPTLVQRCTSTPGDWRTSSGITCNTCASKAYCADGGYGSGWDDSSIFDE